MTNKEAYQILTKRVTELIRNPKVQAKMLEIAQTKGRAEAESWVWQTAIATLLGKEDAYV